MNTKRLTIAMVVIVLTVAGWFIYVNSINIILFFKTPKSETKYYPIHVTFNWEERYALDNAYPSVSYEGELLSGGPLSNSRWVLSSRKIVDGKQFNATFIGKGDTSEDGFKENEVIFYLRSIRNPPKDYIDIYFETQYELCLMIETFDDGKLVNVEEQKDIDRPFIFAPGEYHLHAYKQSKKENEK